MCLWSEQQVHISDSLGYAVQTGTLGTPVLQTGNAFQCMKYNGSEDV